MGVGARARTLALLVGVSACGTAVVEPGLPRQAAPAPAYANELIDGPTQPLVMEVASVTEPSASSGWSSPQACLDAVPLDRKVAQLVLISIPQGQLSAAATVAADRPFGGVLFHGPVGPDIGQGIADLQRASTISAIVALDEEGGRVQRTRQFLPPVPAAAVVAAGTLEDAERVMAEHSRRLVELGFTMNLAPVVDVGTDEPMGDRSYGDDPDTVVAFALATERAMVATGLVPVLKHFPGHGSTLADSHDTAVITRPLRDLRRRDLLPFAELLVDDVSEAVMVGHLAVPDLTDGVPASLSPAAIDGLLRGELGFDGLVVIDAIDMLVRVDGGTVGDRAVLAFAAGADLVMANGVAAVGEIVNRVVDAVAAGELGVEQIDDSVLRVFDVKGVDPCRARW